MEDREIVDLLTRGEQRGLDELLLRHGPMLRYIVGGILSDPREREECLSDVTLTVWHRLGTFDPEKGTLAAWLTVLARNRARNRLRDAGRRGRDEELDPALPDPAPGPEDWAVLAVYGAVCALPLILEGKEAWLWRRSRSRI